MISASEVFKIYDQVVKDKLGYDKRMKIIEKDIIAAAKEGKGYAKVYLDSVSHDLKDIIQIELSKKGYTIKSGVTRNEWFVSWK